MFHVRSKFVHLICLLLIHVFHFFHKAFSLQHLLARHAAVAHQWTVFFLACLVDNFCFEFRSCLRSLTELGSPFSLSSRSLGSNSSTSVVDEGVPGLLVDGVLGLPQLAGLEHATLEFESSWISFVSIPVGNVVIAGDPPHISSHLSNYSSTTLPCPLFLPLSTAPRNLTLTA